MSARTPDEAYLRAFGDAVRHARQRVGLSQEELGFRADLDRTYISGIERGTRNPTVKSIRTIAEALSTRPSRLMANAESRLRLS